MHLPAPRLLAIDGLRGLAVAAVVIEHAFPDLLPGGFAGVDIFFVLSGFLITGQILREHAAGRFSFVGFYARRVRRILPASLMVVLLIAVGFGLLLGPALRPAVAEDIGAAAGSLINIRQSIMGLDYFAAPPASSPVLHYWSLAVEEQFYLLYPLVLLVGLRLLRSVRRVAIGMVAAALLSFVGMLIVEIDPAFYLLPFRAWELLVGGLIAAGAAQGWTVTGHSRRVLGLAGAAAIGAIFLAGPSLGPWPNAFALLPVLGTAALIAATAEGGGPLLTAAPLRALGRISFALYLLHWPLIAAASLIAPASSVALLVAILVAMVAATLSTVAVEEPIRGSRRLGDRPTVAMGVAAMAAVAIAALSLPEIGVRAVSVTPFDNAVAAARDDRERSITDRCITASTAPGDLLRDCHYGAAAFRSGAPTKEASGHPVVVLLGDSHANVWFPVIDAWAADRGLDFVPLIRNACSPFSVGPAPVGPRGLPEPRDSGCLSFLERAEARLRALRPALIVVASNSSRLMADGAIVAPRHGEAGWKRGAIERLTTLRGIAPVFYLGEPPIAPFDPVDCLGIHRGNPAICAQPLDARIHPPTFVEAQARVARAAGVVFLDPAPLLCPDARCTWLAGERPAYMDPGHLTSSGAALLRAPIEATLDGLLFPDLPIADWLEEAAATRPRTIDDGCLNTATSDPSPVALCRYGAAADIDGAPTVEATGRPTVVLFGDTSANAYFEVINRWSRDRGFDLVPVIRSSCSPFSSGAAPLDDQGSTEARDTGCLAWLPAARARIAELDPQLVIVASNNIRLLRDGAVSAPRKGDPEWIEPAIAELERLRTAGAGVLYLAEPPVAVENPLHCLHFQRRDPSVCAVALETIVNRPYLGALEEIARRAGIAWLDPSIALCPDGRCTWIEGERVLYADEARLSAGGAAVVSPLLVERLETLLSR